MKRILVFIPLLFLAIYCNSQTAGSNDSSTWIYAELVGTQKMLSNKVSVEIDFGQETSYWLPADDKIIDPATGKPKLFNSMVDAMNFMGESGWEFVQAYVVTVGNQSVYRWLLKRQAIKGQEGKYMPVTRKDLKKQSGQKE